MKIVGLLPMGGNGTRLGLPFPKPLAPTITDAGIVPLYHHALSRLRVVTESIYAIVSPTTCDCLRSVLRDEGVVPIRTHEKELSGALGVAARELVNRHPETYIALAFPDTIWETSHSFEDVAAHMRSDGALALFSGEANVLDTVDAIDDKVTGVTTKSPDATGRALGWGGFIVRGEALATFTGEEKDGPQLGRLDLGWAMLGRYHDLGTPERYIAAHDRRSEARFDMNRVAA